MESFYRTDIEQSLLGSQEIDLLVWFDFDSESEC